MATLKKTQQQIWLSLSLCVGLNVGLMACSDPATKAPTNGDRGAQVSSQVPSSPSPAGQARTNQSSSTPPVSAKAVAGQSWTQINRGESAQDLEFTAQGSLVYQGTTLLPTIPVSYGSDGSVTDALQLIVSPPSPSGRYNLFKACDRDGMCWAVYLVDRTNKTAKKVDVAKYGGRDWVQWSTDERYAVLAEQMEGATSMVAVELPNGKSAMSGEVPFTANLSSFKWTGDRTFSLGADCQKFPCDRISTGYQGNIESWFAQ